MHFDVAGLKPELEKLRAQTHEEAFWQDPAISAKIGRQIKVLEDKITSFERLSARLSDAKTLLDLACELDDNDAYDESALEVRALESEIADVRLKALLKGPYDSNNAILSLHAGAGGTEAQDWVSMLYRMYTRYCERHNFSVTVLDYLDGDEAGIKSVTFIAKGLNAYGYLKAEKGVHRLVRISPFDSNKRRHTSFASLDVMPEIEDDIQIDIRDEDIKMDTYRSSGAGGQHVNKTDSAVRLTHIPTGIVAACQTERSQMQNRETCMRMLKSKLIELEEEKRLSQISDIKGEMKKIEWGSQIRSYVFHPYSMVKDHRTNYETGNVASVMDGEINEFINTYLINA